MSVRTVAWPRSREVCREWRVSSLVASVVTSVVSSRHRCTPPITVARTVRAPPTCRSTLRIQKSSLSAELRMETDWSAAHTRQAIDNVFQRGRPNCSRTPIAASAHRMPFKFGNLKTRTRTLGVLACVCAPFSFVSPQLAAKQVAS